MLGRTRGNQLVFFDAPGEPHDPPDGREDRALDADFLEVSSVSGEFVNEFDTNTAACRI